eukprot:NODE_8117_length_371_cov_76.341615_g6384_i0.p1 GENE.NODE_8117_length_371_cov_76.341615_g6384_i0~~NODE_8117_length_371_cov_76.341615_g6384_i0.p1  ORF type:complete len:52 (-),score=5.66 NODE_8117_length_371_cov_76.341615_g6384_i0:68-223(-)
MLYSDTLFFSRIELPHVSLFDQEITSSYKKIHENNNTHNTAADNNENGGET